MANNIPGRIYSVTGIAPTSINSESITKGAKGGMFVYFRPSSDQTCWSIYYSYGFYRTNIYNPTSTTDYGGVLNNRVDLYILYGSGSSTSSEQKDVSNTTIYVPDTYQKQDYPSNLNSKFWPGGTLGSTGAGGVKQVNIDSAAKNNGVTNPEWGDYIPDASDGSGWNELKTNVTSGTYTVGFKWVSTDKGLLGKNGSSNTITLTFPTLSNYCAIVSGTLSDSVITTNSYASKDAVRTAYISFPPILISPYTVGTKFKMTRNSYGGQETKPFSYSTDLNTTYLGAVIQSEGYDSSGTRIEYSPEKYILNTNSTSCSVTVVAGANGSVTNSGKITVSKNTTVSISDNIMTIGDTEFVATGSTGYVFNKWSVSSGYIITDTTTISATFKASSCTVTFSTNVDATIGTISPSGSQTYSQGQSVTVTATVKNNNYQFIGWDGYDASSSNEISYTVPNESTATLKAKFSKITKSGTLSYNNSITGPITINGTKYTSAQDSLSFNKGDTVTISGADGTNAKFNYVTVNGTKYTSSFTVGDTDLAIIAYYSLVYTVNVKSKNTTAWNPSVSWSNVASGTNWSISGNTVTVDKNSSTQTADSSLWEFKGWVNDNNVAYGTSGTISSNTNFWADYLGQRFKVSFNTNCDNSKPSSIDDRNVIYKSTYDKCYSSGSITTVSLPNSSNFTRPYYTFSKWALNSISGSEIKDSTSVDITSAATLYAIWSPIEYSIKAVNVSAFNDIKFSTSGGDNVPTTELWKTLPTKPDNIFKQWNTKSDGSGVSFDPGEIVTYSEELFGTSTILNLYAIYEPVEPEYIAINGNWRKLNKIQSGTYAGKPDIRIWINGSWKTVTAWKIYKNGKWHDRVNP